MVRRERAASSRAEASICGMGMSWTVRPVHLGERQVRVRDQRSEGDGLGSLV